MENEKFILCETCRSKFATKWVSVAIKPHENRDTIESAGDRSAICDSCFVDTYITMYSGHEPWCTGPLETMGDVLAKPTNDNYEDWVDEFDDDDDDDEWLEKNNVEIVSIKKKYQAFFCRSYDDLLFSMWFDTAEEIEEVLDEREELNIMYVLEYTLEPILSILICNEFNNTDFNNNTDTDPTENPQL